MAGEAEHADLAAWCLETRAWQALISRDYPRAAAFARDAQAAAPRGSSVLIQATAQEGRAWARLGAARETYDALARVEALVSPLPCPRCPNITTCMTRRRPRRTWPRRWPGSATRRPSALPGMSWSGSSLALTACPAPVVPWPPGWTWRWRSPRAGALRAALAGTHLELAPAKPYAPSRPEA